MGLNWLFRDHASVRSLLARHAGRTVDFRAPPLASVLTIQQDGTWEPSDPSVKADVCVVIDTRALWASGWRPGRPLPERDGLVHVSGDVAIAQTLSTLAKSWRPDLEDLLAQHIGDIPARQLAQVANRLAGGLTRSTGRLAQNFAEYVSHEAALVVARPSLVSLTQRVSRLDHRLGSLEAGVQAVSERLERLGQPDGTRVS